MPPDQLFVCLLTLATVGLFMWEKVPAEIVSMGALFLLLVVPFDGQAILAPPGKTDQLAILGGIFGNNAILTVIFMFIVGAAVERTGLVEVLGHQFERVAGRGPTRILLVLGLLTVGISGFLNNTTVVVVFMPMIIGLCKRTEQAPSRFLIPLSYFAIAGGMCTMIGTSTNLVVNGIVKQKGLEPFAMFDVAPLGIIFAIATIGFMLLFSRKLLPDRASLAAMINPDDGREFLTAAIVSTSSPLVGKLLIETPLAKTRNSRVIEVRRNGNRVDTPLNEIRFEPGDRVILKSQLSGVVGINDLEGLDIAAKSELGLSYVQTEKAVLMEGMLGPHSNLVGRSLSELNFRQQYGLLILALHRQGENLRENFEKVRLEVGDTLLLEGSSERMKQLFAEKDFINLSQPKAEDFRQKRAWVAMLALLLVVVLGAMDNVMPFEWVALGAALLVTLGGCLEKEEIFHAVDWGIITMILGTLGLGLAMDKTGAAKTIVHGLIGVVGHWDKRLILSVVLLFTIVLTELLGNNAVAALLTPLAIELGHNLGCDPRPFIVAVMMGASIGFAIPTGYQTHMLVYGAGGYRFSDFCRAGIPMDLVMWIAGSIAIPLLWSF
jgi:di/tricarboxylate transporter